MANLAREPSVDESKYCASSWERIPDAAEARSVERGGANFGSSRTHGAPGRFTELVDSVYHRLVRTRMATEIFPKADYTADPCHPGSEPTRLWIASRGRGIARGGFARGRTGHRRAGSATHPGTGPKPWPGRASNGRSVTALGGLSTGAHSIIQLEEETK